MKNTTKSTALLIIIHLVMMMTAGIILIFKFDFPDILRKSMEETLGLFIANKEWTVPAYYLFTLTGISFMSVVVLVYKLIDKKQSALGFLAMIFGVLFGLTSSLGFIRWPFLMESLGNTLISNQTDTETLRVIYNSFHTYAGVSVGENFAFWFEFLWMFLFSTSLLSYKNSIPKYIARIGQLLGIGMLIYSFEQFGPAFSFLGPLNMIVHVAQLAWLLALSFLLFNFNTPRKGRLTPIQSTTSATLFIILLIVSFI